MGERAKPAQGRAWHAFLLSCICAVVRAPGPRFGVVNFEFVWDLGFGIWDLGFPLTASAVSGQAVFDSCSFFGFTLTGGLKGSLHLFRILSAFLVTIS